MSSTIAREPSSADWGPPSPLFGEFLDHLRSAGLSEKKISDATEQARHFLVWLQEVGGEIETIDDDVMRHFRDHECRCPRPRFGQYGNHASRSRSLLSGVRRLVIFLEETGRTRHPGECGEGFRLLDEFLERLSTDRYSRFTIKYYRGICRHFIVWLHLSRISMRALDAGILNRFLHHDCLCRGFHRSRTGAAEKSVAVRRFAEFLATRGIAPDSFLMPKPPPREELPEFGDWLRHHRGVCETTVHDHVREIVAIVPDLGDRSETYDAALIRDVLLRRFRRISRTHAQRVAISMRMYLRFLASNGACPPELVGAVPTARSWRLATLPRYISPDAIERVIASCDTAKAVGLRDRAILLLLARLALRAGDIVGLELNDFDWHTARVRVCGKTRRAVGLPIPQDAGDAVLDYIEQARPRVDEEKLFLSVMAPHRPLSRSGVVSSIVHRALKRAGIENAHPQGAYLFRHSAATGLLRSGASLEQIGTLLRHRSMDTTAGYAKVDHLMLLEVSQPWPGDVQ